MTMETTSDRDQALACDTLQRLFPGRQVRGLRAVELVWGLGAYHCITQQQPALADAAKR